jgi:hypothetical protein
MTAKGGRRTTPDETGPTTVAASPVRSPVVMSSSLLYQRWWTSQRHDRGTTRISHETVSGTDCFRAQGPTERHSMLDSRVPVTTHERNSLWITNDSIACPVTLASRPPGAVRSRPPLAARWPCSAWAPSAAPRQHPPVSMVMNASPAPTAGTAWNAAMPRGVSSAARWRAPRMDLRASRISRPSRRPAAPAAIATVAPARVRPAAATTIAATAKIWSATATAAGTASSEELAAGRPGGRPSGVPVSVPSPFASRRVPAVTSTAPIAVPAVVRCRPRNGSTCTP